MISIHHLLFFYICRETANSAKHRARNRGRKTALIRALEENAILMIVQYALALYMKRCGLLKTHFTVALYEDAANQLPLRLEPSTRAL